ncbi:MAG: MarR family winged helix-turn-helix transcriptional regulator [Candidatus Zixiibacteriota bacterium]
MNDCPLRLKFIPQIHRARGQITSYFDSLGKEDVIGAAEAKALFIIHCQGSCAVGELGRVLGYKPSTLSSILNRLDQRELIIRQTHPEDRRSFLLTLSEKGETLAGRLQEVALSLEARIEGSVTSEDLMGFNAVIEAIERVTNDDTPGGRALTLKSPPETVPV